MMDKHFEMQDFGLYSPENVIAENLRELIRRTDVIGEQEIAHLRELALEISQSDDLADLLSSLPYYRISSPSPESNVLTNNAKLLSRTRKNLEARQCMILCHALYKELCERENLLSAFFPDNDEIAPHAACRIVYQRSTYADDAYLAFAPLVPNARAAYAHSFLAACEEVFNGHCEFCILPIENIVEGELIGFAKLITKYGLKIAAVCDVAGTDASRRTRFALLRRNILPFLVSDAEKNGYFRFSFPYETSSLVADVLSAANFYGLHLISLNTIPQGEGSQFNFTFSICGGDIYPFMLYLFTVVPQYTPVGIYLNIKQKGI